MHNFPQQRKGLAEILGSALCSAAEYLSEEKIGGIKAGTVLFFTVLIAGVIAYYYLYPTPIFIYFIIFGGYYSTDRAIPGLQTRRTWRLPLRDWSQICRLGCWVVGNHYRLRLPFERFPNDYWATRRRWSICPIPQMVSKDLAHNRNVSTSARFVVQRTGRRSETCLLSL